MELVQLSNFPFSIFVVLFCFSADYYFRYVSTFRRRLFSVFIFIFSCFQYVIFTLHSQSNYFFILNHHYQIGSGIICSIWQCNVHFVAESLRCVYVCMTENWIFSKLHRLLLKMALFLFFFGCCCYCCCYRWCWENVWSPVTGWLLMVLLHLAMVRAHHDAGHHSCRVNV